MPPDPLTFRFKDDGAVPNNPALPALLYKAAVGLGGDPASELERLFAHNGWGHGQWRDGIYPFTHYHSMIHEVLGWRAARHRCAWAAIEARWWSLKPATSRRCRPAPGISACRPAPIFW